MKIAATISRYLLGIIFLFFGSNLLFHFLPNPPMSPGPMNDFTSALAVTHYGRVLGVFQVVPAILLLINRYIPLALTILAGVIINIDLIHILMAPSGLPVAALITIMWFLVFYQYRAAFLHLFKPHHAN